MPWLSSLLAREFDPGVKQRGAEYFRQGRVKKLEVTEAGLSAVVTGSERYRVRLKWEIDGDSDVVYVAARCECPYALEHFDQCKHVWAVLLASDTKTQAVANSGEIVMTAWEAMGTYGGKGIRHLDVQDDEENYDSDENDAETVEPPKPTPRSSTEKRDKQTNKRMGYERALEMTPVVNPILHKTESEPIGELIYVIDQELSGERQGIVLLTMTIGKLREGKAFHCIPAKVGRENILNLQDERDRMICGALLGSAEPQQNPYAYWSPKQEMTSTWQLESRLSLMLLPELAKAGKLFWRPGEGEESISQVAWDSETWNAALRIKRADDTERYEMRVELNQNGEWIGHEQVPLAVDGMPGLILRGDNGRLSPARTHFAWAWGKYALAMPKMVLTREEIPGLLRALKHRGIDMPIDWPPAWNVKAIAGVKPTGRLQLAPPAPPSRGTSTSLKGKLSFVYGTHVVPATETNLTTLLQTENKEESVVLTRDLRAEEDLRATLRSFNLKWTAWEQSVSLPIDQLVELTEKLNGLGWEVLVGQGRIRRPGVISITMESGIDWFELSGKIEYGETTADVGALLEAMRKGERFVRLGDGSMGMLPTEWLAKQGRWLGLGEVQKDGEVRFSKAQVSVVDAILSQMPEVRADEAVEAARKRLRAFEGIEPVEPPERFQGELRAYQKEGLGWLKFLAEFGFGGCLADDMGLGKTVMILAEFARVHQEVPRGKNCGGWLVVGPKSLVSNWKREAAKFVPWAKVTDYTGKERDTAIFDTADIVITSYGTMRLDIEKIRKRRWACVVLDEAQTIKNESSQVAKAARLLQGDRRIALSGTPVENRLEDLWSIFEFLNPGILGSVGGFTGATRHAGDDGLSTLRRALRPFILRRTKRQVAKDLPEKTEQVIKCEMPAEQRKTYDSLRKHYRESLLKKVEQEGMAKSKIQVLEALLRLRQAACHTGLLPDLARRAESGKLDTLVEMVTEVVTEGHQVLIFSQFTSLLDLVGEAIREADISSVRLDGSTSAKARQAAVDRFQQGKANAFLLSLKAGGVGLNLTAAEYVFLLDPWWNPAVEAQAIDRAHRIGQQKNVFAYKLISADTVEERILELQAKKKELAEAIVAGAEGPLKALTREELEWLLQ